MKQDKGGRWASSFSIRIIFLRVNRIESSMVCRLPWGNKCLGVYIIFGIVVILIVLYWMYLAIRYGFESTVYHDFMNRKVFDLPWLENCCSWWPLSHFIVFFILGVFFPSCDVLVIGAGILWELFEMVMAKLFNRQRQGIRRDTSNRVEYSSNWWAGSLKDIIFNILGFYSGKIFAMIFLHSRR